MNMRFLVCLLLLHSAQDAFCLERKGGFRWPWSPKTNKVAPIGASLATPRWSLSGNKKTSFTSSKVALAPDNNKRKASAQQELPLSKRQDSSKLKVAKEAEALQAQAAELQYWADQKAAADTQKIKKQIDDDEALALALQKKENLPGRVLRQRPSSRPQSRPPVNTLVSLPRGRIGQGASAVDIEFLPVPHQKNVTSCGIEALLALDGYFKDGMPNISPSVVGSIAAKKQDLIKKGVSFTTEYNFDEIKKIAKKNQIYLPESTLFITKGNENAPMMVEGSAGMMEMFSYMNNKQEYQFAQHLGALTQKFFKSKETILPILMNREGHWVTYIFKKEPNGKLKVYHTNSYAVPAKIQNNQVMLGNKTDPLSIAGTDHLSDFEKSIVVFIGQENAKYQTSKAQK